MYHMSTPLRLAFILPVIVLLAACVPGAPSAEEVAAQVATSVALTVEAQNQIAESVALTVAAKETEAAKALPTPTMTAGEPLPTLTPILPTATSFLITPPSSGGGGGGGGGTNPGADYSCDVITRPFDNTEFHKNGEFDIKWVIVNNGTKTWPAGYDLTYYSGPNMTKSGATFVQLPEIKPGETFTQIFDGVAPVGKGLHVMTWKVQGGFCWPYIAIIVK